MSPGAVPAAPLNDGVVSFVKGAGAVSDTAGPFVLTVKVDGGVLLPVLPASSDCSAWAV